MQENNSPAYSIIVALFNEERNLEELYKRISKVMNKLGESYEILFVDDGSTDNSFEVLNRLRKNDSKVKIIKFTRNFGQHIAITAGLDYSKGGKCVIMDADLQDQPEEIPKLAAKLDGDYDIVYGTRIDRKDSSLRKCLSMTYHWFLRKMTNQGITPELATFRIMRRNVVDYVNMLRERSRFFGGLLSWLGFSYSTVEVSCGRRLSGKSKYNFRKMIKLAAEGILSFSNIPLRLAGYLGLLSSLLSFIIGIYIIVLWSFWKINVPGYVSIIVSIFFTGGVLLFFLGVMGEYVIIIHTEVKKRPLYVIREIVGD